MYIYEYILLSVYIYICICIYAIMIKTMSPPGYQRNGFVLTHALGHMMNRTSCPQVHKLLATKPLW